MKGRAGRRNLSQDKMFIFLYSCRQTNTDRLPLHHPEPGHEGGGEGPERRVGLRGRRGPLAYHHLDQGHHAGEPEWGPEQAEDLNDAAR